MKRTIIAFLLIALLALSACSSKPAETPPATTPTQAATEAAKTENPAPAPTSAPEAPAEPPVLTGNWKQENAVDAEGYQYAVIKEDTMEVYWNLPDLGDMLYWAGSYQAPTSADEPYAWASVNDTERTGSALLASGDAEKTFTYAAGKLSYDVTVSGETVTVTLIPFEGELPTAEAPAETAPQKHEGALADYYVKITGHRLLKDYEGKDALVLQYDFTNNSTESASAMWALYAKAFQDGIEMETAFILDDSYLGGNADKEIKPGVTISCETAFVLSNLLSPVEIEVTELISFSDDMVTATINIAQ